MLPFALPYATAVAVRLRDDDILRCVVHRDTAGTWSRHRRPTSDRGAPPGWAAYAGGVLWAMGYGTAPWPVPGVDIAVHSIAAAAVPGLSSSAALECAVALAIAELLGAATDERGRAGLARDCITPRTWWPARPPAAWTSRWPCAPGLATPLLLDCADSTAEHVPLDFARRGSGTASSSTPTRRTAWSDGDYGAPRRDRAGLRPARRQQALREATDIDAVLRESPRTTRTRLPRMRHVLTEIRRVDAVADAAARRRRERHRRATESLTRARCATTTRSARVELDTAVDAALDAGALGARMTGGGFGGSAIALTPVGRDAAVDRARRPRRGRSAACPLPEFLHGIPSGSAHRIR